MALPSVKHIKTTTLVAGSALALTYGFLHEEEGLELEAYLDPVGVPTICRGETSGVELGMVVSKEFCDKLTIARAQGFENHVRDSLRVDLSEKTIHSHTTFAYNIGKGGYSRSKTLQLTNRGELEAGCHAMKGWYRAGGKDCRIRANNCYGLWKRRLKEVEICLEGLKEPTPVKVAEKEKKCFLWFCREV